MNTQSRKIFYWLFGLVFGVLVFFLIQNQLIFSNLNQSKWIAPAISLIIIILFYIVGLLTSKISDVYYLYLNKEKDLSKVMNIVQKEEQEKKLKGFIKNLKKTINDTRSQKYSEESIGILSNYIGIDKESVKKLFCVLKKLRTARFIYWGIGLILAIVNILMIYNLTIFESLRFPVYLPISISLILFFLFFIEGFLMMRIPTRIYVDLLKLNELTKEKQTHKIISTKSKLTQKEQDVQKSITHIKNTIRYLLKLKTNRKWILDLLKNNGFSDNVAKEIIEKISLELQSTPDFPENKTKATKKLLLLKMHEDIINLKQIYSEINELRSHINYLEIKQKKLSGFNSNDYSITHPKSSDSQTEFLYVLIKPHANKYTKEEIESFLLSQGYGIDVISDVIALFKENNIVFKDKNNNSSTIINKIIGN